MPCTHPRSVSLFPSTEPQEQLKLFEQWLKKPPVIGEMYYVVPAAFINQLKEHLRAHMASHSPPQLSFADIVMGKSTAIVHGCLTLALQQTSTPAHWS